MRAPGEWPENVPPWGTEVLKSGAGYEGQGWVRGFVIARDKSVRVVVGHRIEGGLGEFFHIYALKQIQVLSS